MASPQLKSTPSYPLQNSEDTIPVESSVVFSSSSPTTSSSLNSPAMSGALQNQNINRKEDEYQYKYGLNVARCNPLLFGQQFQQQDNQAKSSLFNHHHSHNNHSHNHHSHNHNHGNDNDDNDDNDDKNDKNDIGLSQVSTVEIPADPHTYLIQGNYYAVPNLPWYAAQLVSADYMGNHQPSDLSNISTASSFQTDGGSFDMPSTGEFGHANSSSTLNTSQSYNNYKNLQVEGTFQGAFDVNFNDQKSSDAATDNLNTSMESLTSILLPVRYPNPTQAQSNVDLFLQKQALIKSVANSDAGAQWPPLQEPQSAFPQWADGNSNVARTVVSEGPYCFDDIRSSSHSSTSLVGNNESEVEVLLSREPDFETTAKSPLPSATPTYPQMHETQPNNNHNHKHNHISSKFNGANTFTGSLNLEVDLSAVVSAPTNVSHPMPQRAMRSSSNPTPSSNRQGIPATNVYHHHSPDPSTMISLYSKSLQFSKNATTNTTSSRDTKLVSVAAARRRTSKGNNQSTEGSFNDHDHENYDHDDHDHDHDDYNHKTHQAKTAPSSRATSPITINQQHSQFEIKKKKYTRRRLLPRSKRGCWTCRVKHVKCDETRPTCKNCAKFGLSCDYSVVKPDYVSDPRLRALKLQETAITRKNFQAQKVKPVKVSKVPRKRRFDVVTA
ncbi:uncharacterized protein LODBEIA_P05880 [Lodderomyces beijingensis]|uniref:Zn(2)-C6 fungal-type domain-containing protein n=1 Tax=Lodderomyces beijingensis TaxID=1775926 RepID=A0ABP0ZES4_9ASCO